jgi:hypothetical protein
VVTAAATGFAATGAGAEGSSRAASPRNRTITSPKAAKTAESQRSARSTWIPTAVAVRLELAPIAIGRTMRPENAVIERV